jgi:hypothetical protein
VLAHLDVTLVVKQQVLGLDVPVKDTRCMHVLQAEDDLGDVHTPLILRKASLRLLRELKMKVAAKTQVHDDVQVPIVLKGVVHVDELRAVQPSEEVALLHDHSDVISLENDGLFKRFHRISRAFIESRNLGDSIDASKAALHTQRQSQSSMHPSQEALEYAGAL